MMTLVVTPAGEKFPSIAAARWAAYFDVLVGTENRQWCAEGLDGLPPGFLVRYEGTIPFYCVPTEFADLTPDQWRALLAADAPEARRRYNLLILDGLPALRLYLTPSRVFENAGDCPHCTLNPAQRAEAHGFKPPFDAQHHERDGYGLWSYKGRPWWDDYPNVFGREDDNDIAEVGSHLAAIARALQLPLRFERLSEEQAA